VREMEEPGLWAWWSSAVAVQVEAANRPELLRSKAVVVSVVGNVARQSAAGVDHEGERKQTTDDVSKEKGDIETGDALEPRDEPGGCLSTGQAVSGIEVARAWSGLSYGTCEPVAPRPRAASGAALARGRFVEARTPSG
jgi:hypothetical protein